LHGRHPDLTFAASHQPATPQCDRTQAEAPAGLHPSRAHARALSAPDRKSRSDAIAARRVVRSPDEDAIFKSQLIQLIPHLRAFALSLTNRPEGEDLAQETMLRAWKARDSYQPGTNLKAWLFTILRNQHMSGGRRAWRTRPLDPEVAENTLVANDDPSAREDLVDLRNAIQRLNFEQRQALMLVGAAGLSYTEAAAICDCAEGTIKSRVSRARAQLAAILDSRKLKPRERTDVSASTVFESIMAEASSLQSRVVQRIEVRSAHVPSKMTAMANS
jgi:RNA polymerase sigma-70 factor (ECF subfamily)